MSNAGTYSNMPQLPPLGALAMENQRLRDDVAVYRRELASQIEQYKRVRELLGECEQALATTLGRCEEIEQWNDRLAQLYVATFRINASSDRETILDTMVEIVINMIGSEEVAVFEREGGDVLKLAASYGIDRHVHDRVIVGSGVLGTLAQRDEPYIRGKSDVDLEIVRGTGLNACLPLKANGELIGLIAVFSLLTQKPNLSAIDHELFEVLSVQGARALHATRLARDEARVRATHEGAVA